MILSIDLGGTKLRCAVIEDGEIIFRSSIYTITVPAGGFIDQLVESVTSILNRYPDRIQAISIGVPGPTRNMIMQGSMPLEYKDNINFAVLFQNVDLPIIVKNDLQMAGYCELYRGAGKKYEKFFLVSLSTGIGTAYISNNSVSENRIEIGHQVLFSYSTDTYPCLNHSNCWISLASGNGIVNRFATDTTQTTEDIFGSVLTEKEIKDIREINAYGFGTIINSYDPQAIVIMGSLGLAQFDKIIPPAVTIEKYTVNRPIPPVIKCCEESDIGVFGAYYAAIEYLESTTSTLTRRGDKSGSTPKLIGFVGLGKMGLPMCQLISNSIDVIAYDNVSQATSDANQKGLSTVSNIRQLVGKLPTPRILWLMVPAGGSVDILISELAPLLEAGDIIVDGGNSNYLDSSRRGTELANKNIHFVSIGTSGGLSGAQNGPPLTVSCEKSAFDAIKPVLDALGGNYAYYSLQGGGHLAKSIHNAIEYGMMQSIAEGVALYFYYGFSQHEILDTFRTWAKGSIIESALVNCAVACLEKYDFQKPLNIKRSETVEIIRGLTNCPIPTPSIDQATKVREHPEVADKISVTTLALMRKTFGGHETSD